MSIAGQQALARLFGLTVDPDASPADPAPTGGLEWIGGVPFPATDEPPPPGDETPDFDAGVRESVPEPENPEQDHNAFMLNLLRSHSVGDFGE